MRFLIILILLAVDPVKDVTKIARTNQLKKEAKLAFEQGEFKKAIDKYRYLVDTMDVEEDAVLLNLANAYYQNQDTVAAIDNYSRLLESPERSIASRSFQQLGIIKNRRKEQKAALADFKEAIKKDPTNEEARYNYEMLKKLLEEQKKEEEQQNQENKENQEQQENQEKKENQEQQNQENQENQQNEEQEQQEKEQSEEGEESEEQNDEQQKSDEQKESEKEKNKKNEGEPEEPKDEQEQEKKDKNDMNLSPEKLKEMNISEEKAKMILEAMKNQEIQYLQQMKRKAEKRPPSGKPDW